MKTTLIQLTAAAVLLAPTSALAGPFGSKAPAAYAQAELPIVKVAKSRHSGKARLKRLLRPHQPFSNPITRSVREATGDPNIAVFDRRRKSFGETGTCSFITYRGKRALVCD